MVVSVLRCSALAVLLVFAASFMCSAQDGDSRPRVSIETSTGTIVVELYNETPKHRDNFLKLAGEGFYDGTLFHRVIGGFMALRAVTPSPRMPHRVPVSEPAVPGTPSKLKSTRLSFTSKGPSLPPVKGTRSIRNAAAAAANSTSCRAAMSRPRRCKALSRASAAAWPSPSRTRRTRLPPMASSGARPISTCSTRCSARWWRASMSSTPCAPSRPTGPTVPPRM